MRCPLALLAILLAVLPVHAQEQPLPPARRAPAPMIPRAEPDQPLPPPPAGGRPPREAKPAPPALPPLPADPKARLDVLFSRLQEAPDDAAARRVEKEIERLFENSGSATANLTLSRAMQALGQKDFATALDLIDYTLLMRPGFAEAYHRRALVHMLRKDEEAALRDLKMTLALEPRHFQSLSVLAALMRNSGNRKAAYQALTKLRDINPRFPDLAGAIEALRPDIEGQPI